MGIKSSDFRSVSSYQAVQDGTGKIPQRYNFPANSWDIFTVDGWKPESMVQTRNPIKIESTVAVMPVQAIVRGASRKPTKQPDNSAALAEIKALFAKKAETKSDAPSVAHKPTEKTVTQDKPVKDPVERAEQAAEASNTAVVERLKRETSATSDEDLEKKLYHKIPGLRTFMAWWNSRGNSESPTQSANPKGPGQDSMG